MSPPEASRRRLAAVLVLAAFPFATSAASGLEFPAPLQLSRAQGLPSSQVHALAQGRDGFIWMAGPAGLARYTGREVEVFGRADGLATHGLRSLAPDGEGGLWIGHDRGIDHWSPADGFRQLGGVSWNFGFVESIAVGSSGTLWLGCTRGVVRGRRTVDGAWIFEAAPEAPQSLITSVVHDSAAGVTWAAGPEAGLWRLENGRWVRPRHDVWTEVAPVRVLAPAAGGGLHVGGHGAVELDGEGARRRRVVAPWPEDSVTAMLQAGDELWLSIGGRVALMTPGPDAWKIDHVAVPGDLAESLMLDDDGTVWVGTGSSGALKFSVLREAVQRLPRPCGGAVFSISRTADGFLVGGSACTWRLTSDGRLGDEIAALAGLQAWDVLEDPEGTLWAATEQGLVSVARGSQALRRSELTEPSRALLRRDADLLVGSLAGLFAVTGGAVRELVADDGSSLGYVYTLESDPVGDRIYVGTLGRGLWVLDAANELAPLGWEGLLPDSNIYSVGPAADGRLAISQDETILVYAGAAVRTLELEIPTRGPSWALRFDADGLLWVGGSQGLDRVDPAEGRRTLRITPGAGLEGSEFTTSRSLLVRPDGSLLCGLDRGASVVVPGALGRVAPLPRPTASSFVDRAGERVPVTGEVLVLPQGVWTLEAHPRVPWFLDESGVVFRYRMVGFDDHWNDLAVDGSAIRYTSLPVGHYRLEIEANSPLTAPSPVATVVAVRVVRPWWWLPTVFAGLLLVAVLGALVPWLRARALRRRSQRLQALIQERTEELAKALDDMERLALEDRLTGLPNRRRFHQEAERMASRAVRTGQDFSLIVTDIDRFKRVNDRWGHGAGDEVLREAARRLAGAARQTDLVCRYGGDEFVALGWNSGGPVHLLAERMLDAASKDLVELSNGERYALRMSFGVCSWGEVGKDLERLFRCADQALYAAKEQGAGVVCWTPDLDSGTVDSD